MRARPSWRGSSTSTRWPGPTSPTPIPILFDRDGAVLESFSPDFYLPELDLYVEITTLRQRLVRKKNRKLRRLRALYPEVRIKLLYARDFRALLLKYGRIALADALSGTEGQSTPPRQPAAGTPRHAASSPGRADGREAPPTAARARRARRSRAEARARVAAGPAGTLAAAAGTAAGPATTATAAGTEIRA